MCYHYPLGGMLWDRSPLHNSLICKYFLSGDFTRHGDYSDGWHNCHFEAQQGGACTGKAQDENWMLELLIRKWFEHRSNIPWLKKITWLVGVLRRTVVGDWCFDNLCRSHFQSQVKDCFWRLRFQQPVQKPSSTWLWRWPPHLLSKHQSPTTVLFRTPITQMVFFNQGTNHSFWLSMRTSDWLKAYTLHYFWASYAFSVSQWPNLCKLSYWRADIVTLILEL